MKKLVYRRQYRQVFQKDKVYTKTYTPCLHYLDVDTGAENQVLRLTVLINIVIIMTMLTLKIQYMNGLMMATTLSREKNLDVQKS